MTDPALKLMIPGPVQVEDDVLEAMAQPIQPHYGPQWREMYTETTGMLKTVFGTRGDVFLLVGSGCASIDACLGSALATGEKLLIGANGFFGDRLRAIAESYGLDPVPVPAEWGRPLRPEDFDAALARHPDVRLVAAVHVETSTGIVNPVAEIGQVARRHGVPFMVDAVSSLGGLPVRMDDWGIDLCASASQKCLGAPPGLAPVAVGPGGWEAIDRHASVGHGWFLDLRVWRYYAREWGSWHPHPSTMPVNNVLALHTSVKSLLADGIESRLEHYQRLARRLRQGLRSIGMPPFTPDEFSAPVLTAAYGPQGVPTSQIVEYLADVHHIKIAGGLGEGMVDRVFRVGHMAPAIGEADVDGVLAALACFRRDRGLA